MLQTNSPEHVVLDTSVEPKQALAQEVSSFLREISQQESPLEALLKARLDELKPKQKGT